MRFLLFFLLLASCAAPLPTPRAASPTRSRYVPIIADQTFTERERYLLASAIAQLEYQTAGALDITVSYTNDILIMNLLRVESPFDMVRNVDKQYGGKVYGYTYQDGRMFLVGDRLDDDDVVFVHVAQHEILHHVGLDHVKSKSSIMYLVTNATQHVTCMDAVDAAEFCRVVGCDAQGLNFCR